MSNGYSTAFRSRALSALDNGFSRKQVCAAFQISGRTLFTWIKLRQDSGDYALAPRPKQRTTRKLTAEKLKSYIEQHPDHYLKEIALFFQVSATAVHKALKKFGISRKKNDAVLRARRAKEAGVSSRNRGDRS